MDGLRASERGILAQIHQVVGMIAVASLLGSDTQDSSVSKFTGYLGTAVDRVAQGNNIPQETLQTLQKEFGALFDSFKSDFDKLADCLKGIEGSDIHAKTSFAVELSALKEQFNALLSELSSVNASNSAVTRKILPLDFDQAKDTIKMVRDSLGNTKGILSQESNSAGYRKLKEDVFDPMDTALDDLFSALAVQRETGSAIPAEVFKAYADCVESFADAQTAMGQLGKEGKLGDYLEWKEDLRTVSGFKPTQKSWPRVRQPHITGSSVPLDAGLTIGPAQGSAERSEISGFFR